MRTKPTPNWLATLLESKNPGEAADALILNIDWGTTKANVPLGVRAMSSPHPELQVAGAQALAASLIWGKAAEQGYAPKIGKAYQDAMRGANTETRAKILDKLTPASSEHLKIMHLLAGDPDPEVRELSLQIVCNYKPETLAVCPPRQR